MLAGVVLISVSSLLCAQAQEVASDSEGNLVLGVGDGNDVSLKVGDNDEQSIVDALDSVKQLNLDLYGREKRDDEGTRGAVVILEEMLSQMSDVNQTQGTVVADTLNSIMTELQSVTSELKKGAKQGAVITMLEGCGRLQSCMLSNTEKVKVVARGLWGGPLDSVYTATYIVAATMESQNPVSTTVVCLCGTGCPYQLQCGAPSFADDQIFLQRETIVMRVYEGNTELPTSDGSALRFTLATSGYTLSFIDTQLFIDHSSQTKSRTIPIKIGAGTQDPSSFKKTASSSNTNVVKNSDVQFNANEVSITVSGYGSTTITLELPDYNIEHTFEVIHRNYFQNCEEVQQVVAEAKSGTYTLKLDDSSQPMDLYCEIYGGAAFTMCGKFRVVGDKTGLENGFARSDIETADLATPWAWAKSTTFQASVDCRKLIAKSGATHILHACYDAGDNSAGKKFRITNLNKEVIDSKGVDLFDVSKELLTIPKYDQQSGKIHTWELHRDKFEDVGNLDGRARLSERCGYKTTWGFTDVDREGALYSNGGHCRPGSEDDTVFWGFLGKKNADSEELYPSYGCSATVPGIDEITIGTKCMANSGSPLFCDVSAMYFGSPDLPVY